MVTEIAALVLVITVGPRADHGAMPINKGPTLREACEETWVVGIMVNAVPDMDHIEIWWLSMDFLVTRDIHESLLLSASRATRLHSY